MAYSAAHERSRRDIETPERIVALANKNGRFSVSLRYRDDWLRARCMRLKRDGLLTGGHRQGSELVFYPRREPRP